MDCKQNHPISDSRPDKCKRPKLWVNSDAFKLAEEKSNLKKKKRASDQEQR